MKKSITIKKEGIILMPVLLFAGIAMIFISAAVVWVGINMKSITLYTNREQAIDIAEAGVNYYRWHLAHAPTDYMDGTTTPGPYVHVYYDKDGDSIGKFSLAITSPPLGSSLVTVVSTGTVDAAPGVVRVIKAQFAKPSLAQYATVANDNMRFGAGTVVYGLLASNGGIHFDGTAYNLVSSADLTYVDPDDGNTHYGVYTATSPADPNPPTPITNQRTDVFQAGRKTGVPNIDFVGITSSISSMQTLAQSAGRYWASSGGQGYHVVVKTDDTFDLYKVTSVTSMGSTCTSNSNPGNADATWGSWSVNNQTFIGNYSFPTSTGVAFFSDNVWVDGQINGARLTIVAAKIGATSNYPAITINNDLMYTNFSGQDTLALISQGNVNVGYNSDNDLVVDAALVAQNGRVGRYYYDSSCGTNVYRNSLTLLGMIATNLRYGFAYTDGTGYNTRTISYDSNLLYAPPPAFPLTSNTYSLVSWQELSK